MKPDMAEMLGLSEEHRVAIHKMWVAGGERGSFNSYVERVAHSLPRKPLPRKKRRRLKLRGERT